MTSSRRGHSPDRVPLPAPLYNRTSFNIIGKSFRSNSFQPNVRRGTDYEYDSGVHNHTEPSTSSLHDNKVLRPCFTRSNFHFRLTFNSNSGLPKHGWMQVCPICLTDPKDMAFGCGHQVTSLTTYWYFKLSILRGEYILSYFPSLLYFLTWQTCCGCGEDLEFCPICRSTITTKIKLY